MAIEAAVILYNKKKNVINKITGVEKQNSYYYSTSCPCIEQIMNESKYYHKIILIIISFLNQ
jgi:hypothetical protein